MTETECPPRELLSAYVDREANPSEERRVDLHMADCGACRARVRSLGRMKGAVRNSPAPPMPADLKRDLLRMAGEADARRSRGLLGRFLDSLAPPAAWGPRGAWGAAAAALVLGLAWGGWRLRGRGVTPVPADFVLAAHNGYARTMPLAPAEKILSELPVQLSYAQADERADVY